MIKHQLYNLINISLKQVGFQRKSNNWYRHTDQTITVVNIDSLYPKLFYLTIGVLFRREGGYGLEEYPTYIVCHFYIRLENIISGSNELFDFNKDIMEREDKIKKTMEELNTWLLNFGNKDSIKELILKNKLKIPDAEFILKLVDKPKEN